MPDQGALYAASREACPGDPAPWHPAARCLHPGSTHRGAQRLRVPQAASYRHSRSGSVARRTKQSRTRWNKRKRAEQTPTSAPLPAPGPPAFLSPSSLQRLRCHEGCRAASPHPPGELCSLRCPGGWDLGKEPAGGEEPALTAAASLRAGELLAARNAGICVQPRGPSWGREPRGGGVGEGSVILILPSKRWISKESLRFPVAIWTFVPLVWAWRGKKWESALDRLPPEGQSVEGRGL